MKLTVSSSLFDFSLISERAVLCGIVLYFADKFGRTGKTVEDWRPKDALIMGLWQMLALIPGTSRSGITITGARQLGYARLDAARISMLMSIPTIIASGVLLGAEVAIEANANVLRDAAIAAGLSMLAALAALALMMRLLRSVSFTPYVIYRVILGLVLLSIAYQG